MKSKYRNKPISLDGTRFDSKKEADRYMELKILEKAGEIEDLKLQPVFLLQDSFKKDGKTYRKIEYIADFMYTDLITGKTVVEDVKGYKTQIYQLKKKIFIYKYPDLEFREL